MTLTAKKILFGAMASLLLYSFAGFYNAESGQRAERDSTGNRFVVKMLTFFSGEKKKTSDARKRENKEENKLGFPGKSGFGNGGNALGELWDGQNSKGKGF